MSRRWMVVLLGAMLVGCNGKRELTVTWTFPFPAELVYQTGLDRFGDAHRISPHMFNVRYLDDAVEPDVGVRREVWTEPDGSSWMQEEILELDRDQMRTKIAIIAAEGVPVDTDATFVEGQVTADDDASSTWTTTMHLRTKPAFLRTFAKGGVKSDIEDMLIGLEHHLTTGEDVDPDRFDEIAELYR